MERGRRRARVLTMRALGELRTARELAGLSQSAVAKAVGMTQASYWRLEAGQVRELTVERVSEVASVLGFEISLGLHPIGDPIRDKGQLAVARRFQALLSEEWEQTDEMLLPGEGEQRAWDKLLELTGPIRPISWGSISRRESGTSRR